MGNSYSAFITNLKKKHHTTKFYSGSDHTNAGAVDGVLAVGLKKWLLDLQEVMVFSKREYEETGQKVAHCVWLHLQVLEPPVSFIFEIIPTADKTWYEAFTEAFLAAATEQPLVLRAAALYLLWQQPPPVVAASPDASVKACEKYVRTTQAKNCSLIFAAALRVQAGEELSGLQEEAWKPK